MLDIPPPDSLPPQLEYRVYCSITASIKYDIPANIMLAVAEQEGGTPGKKSKNKNGTYDLGALQFNTQYVSFLNKNYGITADDVSSNTCYPFDLASWRIYNHIKNDKGNIWTKVSNYHSYTPKYNKIYAENLKKRASKWAKWLKLYFYTNEMGYLLEKKEESLTIRNQKRINIDLTNSHTPRAIYTR